MRSARMAVRSASSVEGKRGRQRSDLDWRRGGHGITSAGVVAGDFKLRAVVIFEEGFEVVGDGVLAEVGREVADAEAAVGGSIVSGEVAVVARGELAVADVLAEEFIIADALQVVEHHAEFVLEEGIGGVDLLGSAEGGDGLGRAAGFGEEAGEAVDDVGAAGGEGDGGLEFGLGLAGSLAVGEQEAEAGAGVGVGGAEGDGGAEVGFGGFHVAEGGADHAELAAEVGIARGCRGGGLEVEEGLAELVGQGDSPRRDGGHGGHGEENRERKWEGGGVSLCESTTRARRTRGRACRGPGRQGCSRRQDTGRGGGGACGE